MVGDSFIAKAHGIQYCEQDDDCRCYEHTIKRLTTERDQLLAVVDAVAETMCVEMPKAVQEAYWNYVRANTPPTTPRSEGGDSPPQDWIERCAKVADLRAEVAEAAVRLDMAHLHDITDVHAGRAAIARDIAKDIRALALLPTPPKESETR